MDADEYLRRAMEENLRITEERQQSIEETRTRQHEAEERAFRESEAAAARSRQDRENEDEALRLALERSAADEAARARATQRAMDRMLQMDRNFGSGSSTHRRSNTEETGTIAREQRGPESQTTPASTHRRSNTEETGTIARDQRGPESRTTSVSTRPRRRNSVSGGRPTPRPSRIQSPVSSTPPQTPRTSSRAAPTALPTTSQARNPARAQGERSNISRAPPSSGLSSPRTRALRSLEQPTIGSSSRTPQGPRTVRSQSNIPFAGRGRGTSTGTLNPAHYSLNDILRRSRTESFATGDYLPEDQGFEAALQAAINESADQPRDEDEEAMQRSMGIPTYEEACRMPRYRAPRGARYVFQGPPGGEGEAGKVEGDMDLGEAMRVANKNVKRRGTN